mmetsp:Transcript_54898/g.123321  ORF Transcript_54898/g.123321 Transcript_54898/m.123321 type:complete len:623 (+) Transcript_54898:81-1949(+)
MGYHSILAFFVLVAPQCASALIARGEGSGPKMTASFPLMASSSSNRAGSAAHLGQTPLHLLVTATDGTNHVINMSVELDPNSVLDSAIGSSMHVVGDVLESIWKYNPTLVGAVRDSVGNVTSTTGHNQNLVIEDGIGDVIAGIGDAAGTIAAEAAAAVEAVTQVMNYFQSLRAPLDEGGATTREVNTFIILGIAIASVTILLGFLFDQAFKESMTPGRPKVWLITCLVTGYAFLIPGLYQLLFSFVIAVRVLGFNIIVSSPVVDGGFDGPRGPITESMLSVLRTLWLTGGYVAVVLVVLYAIVIPAVKLCLIVAGEYFRFSDDPSSRRAARMSIQTVQIISKWACPDMFAYILLIYLLRDVTSGVHFIVARSHLDVGFACFSIFCVLSTFSSLAISPPELIADASVKSGVREKPSARRCTYSALLALVLAGGFAICMGFGIVLPCMGLNLHENMLFEPKGPLPNSLRPVVKVLQLDRIASEVTLSESIGKAWAWSRDGEGVAVHAVVMQFVFVVVLPILEVLCLVGVALGLLVSAEKHAFKAMQVAKYLHHIAMLDVFVVGVVVVNLGAVTYRSQGLVTSIGPGTYFLLGAEVAHYIVFYALDWVVEAGERPLESGSKDEDA